MDTRYLPFYGGLFGGSLQPYLYSLYNGYGYAAPFGLFGNPVYGGYGLYGGYSNYGFPVSGYGAYGFPGYSGTYSYGVPFGFYGNMGYGNVGYGNYGYGD